MNLHKIIYMTGAALFVVSSIFYTSCSDNDDEQVTSSESNTKYSNYLTYDGKTWTKESNGVWGGIYDLSAVNFYVNLTNDTTWIGPFICYMNHYSLSKIVIGEAFENSDLHIAVYTKNGSTSTSINDLCENDTEVISGSITPVATGMVDVDEDTSSKYYTLQFDNFTFTTDFNPGETFCFNGLVSYTYSTSMSVASWQTP